MAGREAMEHISTWQDMAVSWHSLVEKLHEDTILVQRLGA